MAVEASTSWEAEAMARVRAGDASALAAVYDHFAGFVFSLARRVTRDDALAEEVTQEVFTLLWEHPSRFDAERGTLRSFIGAMTHRRAVDCVRHEEALRRRESAERTLAGDAPDIAEQVAAYLTAEDVRAAVEALPAQQREPVILAYFSGYTFAEVGAVLGIAEGTAKSRIRLALAKLRRATTTGVPAT